MGWLVKTVQAINSLQSPFRLHLTKQAGLLALSYSSKLRNCQQGVKSLQFLGKETEEKRREWTKDRREKGREKKKTAEGRAEGERVSVGGVLCDV